MEEEERKNEQSVREKTQKTTKKIQKKSQFINKVREVLSVPILGKIILILALFIVIAFFLVGTIMFFQSMPNQTRDRLDEIIGSGVTWEDAISGTSSGGSGVMTDPSNNQEVLVSAAMDLILKGYDLEGYGFLDPDAGDKIRYKSEESKEIQSIQSKYLQAYIAANEATYEIANGNNSTLDVTRYSEDLVLQIITEGDPTAWVDKSNYGYFLEVLEGRIDAYLDENDTISKEDLANQIATTISDFNSNSAYKQIASSRGETPQIRSVTEEEILAFMEDNAELDYSTGLIDVEGCDGVQSVTIDRAKKQLVVTVDGLIPSRNGEEAIPGSHTYYYNLEGWLTKYARPYEFLLTLHLATMAPEFAYEVATSPETNAKVTIDFKQTSVEIDLVVDEKVAAAEGLEPPADPTVPDLGIAQKGEISALEQCNTDMNFWYDQYTHGIFEMARSKAEAKREEIAIKEAQARRDAYLAQFPINHYDKNGKLSWVETADMDRANEIYEQTKNAIINNDEVRDYIHDRAYNWYHAYLGLIGALTNVLMDAENGQLTIDGEDVGETMDKLTPKGSTDEKCAAWLEQMANAHMDLAKSLAEEYNSIASDKAYYPEPIEVPTVGTIYNLYLGEIFKGSMEVDIGNNQRVGAEEHMDDILKYIASSQSSSGSVIANMMSLYAQARGENGETSTSKAYAIIEKIIDPFTDDLDTNTFEMFDLGLTDAEFEHFMYIFLQIEKLECLYKAIAGLPSKVNFETYTPYIVKVNNHWFRNLTFRRIGTETLEGFDAYSEDETRTNYQYYTRYFRWELDPLITLYAQHPYGDPDRLYEQLGFTDCTQTTGYKYNVVELRFNAIEQIDNPRVTDNSAFIRSLINDKEYIIYDGEAKTDEQLPDDAKEPINISKISVNSYAALEAMPDETSEILVRNLKELFKNTNLTQDEQVEEFAETHTIKPLANIFPDYKPYTPWPNIWERFEENNYTAMIFKNMNRADGQAEDGNRYHYLEAPADGVVTSISGDKIEFAYRSLDGELYTLYVEIDLHEAQSVTIKELVQPGDTVTTGTNLLVMTVPNSLFNYQIQVNIALVDNKGQNLYVPDYMEVPQRELTAEEIIYLHNFIMNEAAGQGYWGHAAIAAVVFNRIKYPLMYASFVDCVDIFTTMDYTINPPGSKNGSWNEKDVRTKLWGTERYPKLKLPAYGGAESVSRSILMAIATAARGFDPTKGGQFSAVPLRCNILCY